MKKIITSNKKMCMFEASDKAVFEIKGALGAQRAQSCRRAHNFQDCAPGLCMIFEFLIGCTSMLPGAQNKWLISNTVRI